MPWIRRLIERHGRWLAVSFMLALVPGFFVGYWGVALLYAAFNGAGAVLYLDGLDPRRKWARRRGLVVKILAAVLLPVGILGLLVSKSGGNPSDYMLDDGKIRNHTASAGMYGPVRQNAGR